MRKILLLVAPMVLVSVSFIVWGAKYRAPIAALVKGSPKLEKTQDKQIAVWQEQFDQHLIEIWPKAGKVFVAADGYFRINSAGDTSATFILSPGDVFYAQSERHGTATFRLKTIEPDDAVIEYESRFDHRSFGKNLIVVDRGTFKVNWK